MFKNFYLFCIIALISIMACVTGAFFYLNYKTPDSGPVACTIEAKLCPDGSYVGRQGPKCEFVKCPDITGYGVIKGKVDVGPICPVEREGVPCPVPPEAYTSREVVIYGSDGYTEKEKVALDKEGNYKIA